ncbi:Yos1-like protein, partial [Meira miltonrushii]
IGLFIYVSLLLVNAIAILNEERFLARIGWSSSQSSSSFDSSGFGGQGQEASVKTRLIHLISAVRTLLRGMLIHSIL